MAATPLAFAGASPAPSRFAAARETLFTASASSPEPTIRPLFPSATDCVIVPADDNPIPPGDGPNTVNPLLAFTIWFRARFPLVVVSRIMLPLFVVTPDRPATLSIWLLAGAPIPVSSNVGTVPMVKPRLSLRYRKLFPVLVARPASTGTILALGSPTEPTADTSKVLPVTAPPVCRIAPAASKPTPPAPALTFSVSRRSPELVTRNPILALLVTTPDNAPVNSVALIGFSSRMPKE